MTIPHVPSGSMPLSKDYNALIDRSAANMKPGAVGMPGSSGAFGQTVGPPPPQVGTVVKWVSLNGELDGDSPATSVSGDIMELNVDDDQWDDTGDDIDEVYPGYLVNEGKTLASGTRVAVVKVNGRWSALGAACD